MKTIIVNASPRKNWNTAQLLKEAQQGAESAGAQVEYVELFDLAFTGCRSCMVCKAKAARHPGCAWKDDLSPLIDRILAAEQPHGAPVRSRPPPRRARLYRTGNRKAGGKGPCRPCSARAPDTRIAT